MYESICQYAVFSCPLVPNGDPHFHCANDNKALMQEGEGDYPGRKCTGCSDSILCIDCFDIASLCSSCLTELRKPFSTPTCLGGEAA